MTVLYRKPTKDCKPFVKHSFHARSKYSLVIFASHYIHYNSFPKENTCRRLMRQIYLTDKHY